MLLSALPPERRLSVARLVAVTAMPYFAQGLFSLVPKSCPGLGTCGVTHKGVLMVDLDFVGTLTPAQMAAVYVHEYSHIYLRHHERAELIRSSAQARAANWRELFNVASDMEINDGLLAAGLDLPFGPDGSAPLTNETFGLPPHLTAEVYFWKLVALQEENKENNDTEASSALTDLLGGLACTSGQCGSGSGGNPLPGEADISEDSEAGRSPVEQEVTRQTCAKAVKDHAKASGAVPGSILRAAEDIVRVVPIPWFAKLRAATGRAVAFTEGLGRQTYARANRNQAAFGLFCKPTPVLPGSVRPRAVVAVAIDTSMSIPKEALDYACGMTLSVIKALRGDAPLLLVCDAALHACVFVRKLSEINNALTGGGGTDFRPVFDAIDAMPVAKRPKVLAFVTDGYGTYPRRPPKGLRVIWLNIDGRIGVPWGEVIHVKLDEGA